MAYVPLDENFFSNPKVTRITAAEAALYIAGLCYCQRHMTDGLIPKLAARSLAALSGMPRSPSGLVAAHFWIDRGDHYEVHDWLQWNTPAEEQRARIDRAKERARERKRRQRNKADGHAVTQESRRDRTDPSRPQLSAAQGSMLFSRAMEPPDGSAVAGAEGAGSAVLDPPTPVKLDELASASEVMAEVARRRSTNGDGPT